MPGEGTAPELPQRVHHEVSEAMRTAETFPHPHVFVGRQTYTKLQCDMGCPEGGQSH